MTAATLLNALEPQKRPSMVVWMLLSVFYVFLYYVRKRCKHLPVLLLLHGLAVVVLYALPAETGVNRGVRLLVGTGFVIYSLHLRFRTEDFDSDPLPLPLVFGISFFCLFLQHYQGDAAWDLYYRLSLILVFLLYAVILFLQSYEDFLTLNRLSTGRIPFREIFRSGLRSTAAFVLFSGMILILISQFAWLKPFLQVLRSGLLMVLRFLFGLLPADTAEPEAIIEQSAGSGEMPLPPSEEPFILWVILEYIAIIALLIAAVYLLYRGFRRLVAFLQEKWQFSEISGEESAPEDTDKRERLEAPGAHNDPSGRKKFSFLFHPDAAQKIRRLYQKKISTCGLAKERIPFYTARDAQKDLGITGMAEIYEKARYSDFPCTEEDVRSMKNKLR